MEWVVGQWVEAWGRIWRIIETEKTRSKLDGNVQPSWWCNHGEMKPFQWQVGKTYRTTMDGVTATIKANDVGGVRGVCEGVRSFWDRKTGAIVGYADPENCPHLLPFLADEPSKPETTLTERYTVEKSGDGWLVRDHQDGRVARFSTRDNAEYGLGMIKDGDDEFCWRSDAQRAADKIFEADPINPQHYRYHPSGIECIQVAEHMSYCIGNAIKYLWRAGKKGDAVEDLKKAAWYINREIERLTKGGAE